MRLSDKRANLRAVAAAVAFSAIAGVAQAQTVVELIKRDPALTIFADVVARSGLETRLASAGPFTIYAPTDSAIERMSYASRQRLLSSTDQAELQKLVLSHVTNYDQQLYFGGGGALVARPTLAGNTVEIERTQGNSESGQLQGISLNGGRVSANLRATNGWVHYLDTVVMPPR